MKKYMYLNLNKTKRFEMQLNINKEWYNLNVMKNSVGSSFHFFNLFIFFRQFGTKFCKLLFQSLVFFAQGLDCGRLVIWQRGDWTKASSGRSVGDGLDGCWGGIETRSQRFSRGGWRVWVDRNVWVVVFSITEWVGGTGRRMTGDWRRGGRGSGPRPGSASF